MLEGVNPVADALGEGDQPEAHSKHDGTCYARILKLILSQAWFDGIRKKL